MGPSICLNMIVRDEAHVVREALDAAAPFISSWVIVDTGSTDGTQDLIKEHMAGLGIPGELHERPWVDFGHNRSEALTLAQGHADYIWMMDADDIIVGTPDFTDLTADAYMLPFQSEAAAGTFVWRLQLFRDGLPWRYEGAIHEHPSCAVAANVERIKGDCHVQYRKLGRRDRGQDRDLLLAAIERNPGDVRSVFHLAQSYFDGNDFDNARQWFLRLMEMDCPDEAIYIARHQLAVMLEHDRAPWPEVRNALLDLWECRPTRAEPAYQLAEHYWSQKRFAQGYRFARIAADIPYPERDTAIMRPDIYAFRAAELQLACAASLGAYPEVFALCRALINRPGIPDGDRQRIAGHRDQVAPAMIQAAAQYPEALVQRLPSERGDVCVNLIAGPDRKRTEDTLNSFLNCCTDIGRAGRFLALDAGLSPADRETLRQRYGFLEFTENSSAPTELVTRYRLNLGEGWRFFAPDNLLTRLIAILDAEPDIAQVGINYRDATTLAGTCAPENQIRRSPGTGRYLLHTGPITGPSMTDTTRPPTTTTATLDEVLAIATPTKP